MEFVRTFDTNDLHAQRATISDLPAVLRLIRKSAQWLVEKKGLTHWLEYYDESVVKKKILEQETLMFKDQQSNLIATVSISTEYPVPREICKR